LVAGAGAGHAQVCSYPDLVSGAAQTASATPQPFRLNQTAQFWTGVAVRAAVGSDWNLEVYQTTAAFPACVSTVLGVSSGTSGVDFVVGDFNPTHNPLALYYPQVTRASGAGDATVEWDAGTNSLVVNGPLINRATGATDVIEVWDVQLQAGHDYRFLFSRTGADVKLLLFKSGPGAYWAGRSAALFEVTGNQDYTPTSSGFFGVVVINDNGAAGSYSLGVGECRAPDALTSGVSVSTSGLAERDYVFDQNHTFFMALGARGSSNWNVQAYSGAGGGTYPSCLSGQLASSSQAAPTVDFVVGNFTAQLPGVFYARVHLDQDQGSGSAQVEWDGGADYVLVNGASINRATDANDVLEVWDVFLTSGQTYQVLFNTTGADLRLLLFTPGTSWAGRSSAILTRTGDPAYQQYVATNTGWHGVVVVNENGAAGSYELRINQGVVGIEDGEAPATALAGLVPNPARGRASIHFALHDAAPVSFEVLDIAGRVVAETPDEERSAGRWTLAWDGRGRSGARLSPGVYFLRMRVAGRAIALRKFALLD
jgi:hypothetical protein